MAANPEDLQSYGVQIQGDASRLFPVQRAPAFTPSPSNGMSFEQAMGIRQQMQQQAQPTGAASDKFPDWVARAQGTGPKLDPDSLRTIKDRYKVDRVSPWANSQKGQDKGFVEAMEAQFDQRAEDWIEQYLAQGDVGGKRAAAATDEDGWSLGRVAEGLWDTAVSAGKSIVDLVPDVVDLANNSLNKRNQAMAGYMSALLAGEGLDEAGRRWEQGMGSQSFVDDFTSWWREGTADIRDAMTTQQTLDAHAGLQDLMNKEATTGEILQYLYDNPSAAAVVGGDMLGQLAPALATGGASATIKGTALAQRLAAGGRGSRFLGRALENIPSVAAVTGAQTGRGLGTLQDQVMKAPIEDLLQSESNQELMKVYTDMGLPKEQAEKAFRETLIGRATGTVYSSNAATGALSLGLGAPLERGVAGIVAPGLRNTTTASIGARLLDRAKGAVGGAAEEGISSLPQDIGQNVIESEYTGQEVPLEKGVKQNAVLNVLGGGILGGVLRRTRRPDEPAPESVVPPDEGEGEAEAGEGGAAAQAPVDQDTPPASMAPPGVGLAQNRFDRELQGIASTTRITIGNDPDLKKAFGKMSAPEDIIGGIQTIIDESDHADAWRDMTLIQRQGALEAAAGEAIKHVKNAEAKQGLLDALKQARETLLVPPQVTPAAPVDAPAVAPAQPAAAPAAPQGEAATPVAPAAPGPTNAAPAATDEDEVIRLPPQPAAAPPAAAPAAPAAPPAAPAAPPAAQPPAAQPATPTGAKPLKAPKPPKATKPLKAPTTPPVGPKAKNATAASPEPKLPPELAKATPAYAIGDRQFQPEFESDIDRAAYGSTGKSAAKYIEWLNNAGFTDAGIAALRTKVKQALKGIAQNTAPDPEGKPQTVKVPTIYNRTTAAEPTPVAPPKKPLRKAAEAEAAAQDKATEASKEPTPTVAPPKKGLRKPKTEAQKEADAQDAASRATKPLRKPKAEGKKPPKTKAPAEKPGQATQTPAPNKQAATARETPEQAVKRIVPDLEDSDYANVLEGVRLGRIGDMSALNQALSDLGDTVSKEDKAALREAAKQQTPKDEGLTEAEQAPKVEPKADPYATMPKSFANAKGAWAHAIGHSATMDELLEATLRIEGLSPHTRYVIEKIIPVARAAGMDTKLRNISKAQLEAAERAGIRPEQIGGVYDPVHNTFMFVNGNNETLAHEAIHAVTAHLLTTVSTNPTIQKAQKDMRALLDHVRAQIQANPNIVESFAKPRARKAAGPYGSTTELIAYGLTDPSTMRLLQNMPASANAPSTLQTAWDEFLSIVAKVLGIPRNKLSALDELVNISESIFGAIEAAPNIWDEAHMAVFFNRGRTDSRTGADVGGLNFQINNAASPVGTRTQAVGAKGAPRFVMDRIWELFNNAQLGIERAAQEVVRKGGTVTDKLNPMLAFRRASSWLNEQRALDRREVVEPLENWLLKNMSRFGETNPEMFRKHLDQFLQNYHALHERNPTIWSEQVELKGGKDIQRLLIIKRAKAGKITGEEMNKQLIALANKHAVESLDKWAATNAARDPARARKVLAALAKKGYTAANLGDLNTLLDNIRDRNRSHNLDSGDVHADDPFANRGWKWYVPLKGTNDVSENAADFDIGSSKGTAKAFRAGLRGIMGGRTTRADNVLEQLVVDMSAASSRRADTMLKRELMPFIIKNAKILGAQFREWKGTPKGHYETTQVWKKRRKGEAPKVVQTKGTMRRSELPRPENGFIFNKGDEHIEVQFPDDSLLMRGLTGEKRIKYPDEEAAKLGPLAVHAANAGGFVTNTMARLMTTINPLWTATTAFLRDTNALPVTVASEVYDNPLQASRFLARYAANLGGNILSPANIKNWGPEIAMIFGNEKAFADYARDPKNAGTFAARVWDYRQHGGSTEYAQGFNKEGASRALFDKLRNANDPNLLRRGGRSLRKGVDALSEVTGNWAQYLELKARVAAYDALVAEGKDKKTAAAIVKGALDFGQSGELGKTLNMLYAFYRVSATGADVIRRITTDKTGHFNWKKTASWGTFMATMGYLQYMIVDALLGDDDDKDENGNPRSKLSKYDINTLTQSILVPDGKGGAYTYKIGLGLPQLMMAPGIITAHVQNGGMTKKEGVDAMYEVFTRNYPAIQPAGRNKEAGLGGFIASWLFGMMPTAGQPFTQHATNMTRFGSNVHTMYPKKGVLAVDQGMPETAPEYKDFAKEIYDATGVDAFPETYRHYMTQYGGQLASQALYWTVERQNKEEQGVELSAARTALRLGVNDADFYYRKESRKAMTQLQAAKAQIKYHEENDEDEGREWLRENPDVKKRAQGATALDSARDAYFEELARIRGNKLMSPEGKRSARKRADAKLREATNKARKLIEETEG